MLVDEGRLAARVAELGAQITADYADEPPLLVAVLKGAMLFMSDLCRAIALPVDVDFMAVSSYGSATKTSGVVRIVKDLDSELEGRHVLVVEDIIDSGLTLNYLRRYLNAREPEEPGDLRAAGQGGRAAGRARPALRRLHHPARVRGRLRARRGRALPQPARGAPLQGEHERERRTWSGCGRPCKELLIAIGEDPGRDGLVATPDRVASMYEELFSGLHDDPARHLEVTFAAEHDEMVMVRDIPFASLCEHHLVPFLGKAHVAYIPAEDGRITGLSKLARLVDGFARRLQVQERMTTQIADAIERRPLAPGRAGRDRGRAPVHVDAGRQEAGHRHGHLVGARACSAPTSPPGPRRCSSSGAADPGGGAAPRVREAARDGGPQRHAGLLLRRGRSTTPTSGRWPAASR